MELICKNTEKIHIFFCYLFFRRKSKQKIKPTFFSDTFFMIKKYPKNLADMNAARSVRPPTAAAKVNWTLTRFCTQL
jgi:hypothetical protein